ncbi:DNA ligase (NAD(+)) [Gracilaria domingensis]|nr:DNA ligase (NAD(+)) [Gracilaria domingensis]
MVFCPTFICPTLPLRRARPVRLTVRAISKRVSDIRHYPEGTDKEAARKIRADEKRKARREALRQRDIPKGYLGRPGAGIHPYGSVERGDAQREARAKYIAGKPGTSEALFRYTSFLSGGECDMIIDRLRAQWLERVEYEVLGKAVRLNQDMRFLYNKLIDEIKLCDEMYYADDPKPRIPDQEYDELVLHLLELERCFPELIRDDSPSQTVGHGAAARATKLALENEVAEGDYVDAQDSFVATVPVTVKRFAQCRHNALMLSLDNAYTHADLTAFVNRSFAVQSEVFAELKIDGVALSLEYHNRELCLALTRGTGRLGDDITENVKESLVGRGVVNNIPDSTAPDFLIVRGEVYITKEDFREVNNCLERPYSNPRNAAAGALKHKNPHEGKERRLRFIAYECLTGNHDDERAERDDQVTAVLHEIQNTFASHSETLSSSQGEAEAFAIRIEEERPQLPMEVDGIVYKFNDSRAREMAGHTARAPRGAIAYKFAAQSRVTRLNDVVMQVSRGGLITPVAILEPVRIAGALMSRATLHNFDEVKRLGVAVGDMVRIERGGDVIPKVLQVEKRLDDPGRKEVVAPSRCPSCGSELKHARAPRTGATLIGCTNDDNCTSQAFGRLIYFCSRDAMDIRGLGKKTAEKLVESGVVVFLADLFRLTLDDLLNLEGFAMKSALQLYENIQEASSSRSFERLILGLGFPGVGRTGARGLALKIESLSNLIDVARSENAAETLMTVANFAEKTVEGLLEHLRKQRTLDELDAMKALVSPCRIVDEDEKPVESTKNATVADRNFVFTGKFVTVNRPEAMKWIRRSGGFVKSSVTHKTDYVIYGLEPGQKLFQAQRRKVQIIPEEEFFSVFQVSPAEQKGLSTEKRDKQKNLE